MGLVEDRGVLTYPTVHLGERTKYHRVYVALLLLDPLHVATAQQSKERKSKTGYATLKCPSTTGNPSSNISPKTSDASNSVLKGHLKMLYLVASKTLTRCCWHKLHEDVVRDRGPHAFMSTVVLPCTG